MPFHIGAETWGPYVLYVGAYVAILASLLKWPEAGLYYLAPLLPLQSVRYRLHEFPLGNQLIDAILLAVAAGMFIHRRVVIPRTPLTAPLAVLSIFAYISLWQGSIINGLPMPSEFSDRRSADWKNFLIELPWFCLLCYAGLRTRRQLAVMLAVMSLGVLMVSRSFHRNAIASRDYSSFSYDLRDSAAMGGVGVNGLAAFQAEACVFALALASFPLGWRFRLGALVTAGASAYSLVYSLSRGAYAAFLISLLLIILIRARWWIVPLALAGFNAEILLPAAVTQRILMTQGAGAAAEADGEADHSTQVRLTLWEDSLGLAAARPVFGWGFATYAYMGRVDIYRDTHNLYLKLLIEGGVVGLAIYLYFFLRATRTGWSLFRAATGKDPFLAAIGLGMFLHMLCFWIVNIFGDRFFFFQISGYTFALLGLALRAKEILAEDSADAATEPALLPEPASA